MPPPSHQTGAIELYQVPELTTPFETDDPLLSAWDDLEDCEAALGIRPGQWFILGPDERPDPDILAFFGSSTFVSKAAGTQRSYARDLKIHFEFLAAKGKTWRNAEPGDLGDYEFWRRRDLSNLRRVSGAKFNREIAACRLFYEWQARRGTIRVSPVELVEIRLPDGSTAESSPLRSRDVRSTRVNWLTPRAYRAWRDVGMCGYDSGGLRDDSWRGRNEGRNLAFVETLWESGLRLREVGTLLTWELPERSPDRYQRAWVGANVAKGSGRHFWVSSHALGLIEAYSMSARAEAIRRAQAEGRYDELRNVRFATGITRNRWLSYHDENGEVGRVRVDDLSAAERSRLFIRTDEGVEPLWLWLGESGLPMSYLSWEATFHWANRRCEQLGTPVRCHPHMLRHSFALRMLVTLMHLFDRRLGLTPEERREYRHMFGDPWVMVKDLLGHRSVETTKNIYLEPATGLQIELFLNGDPGDQSSVTALLSHLAAANDRMIDIEDTDE